MRRKLKIAAAQLISTPAHKEANWEKIHRYTKAAAEQGVDIVCFPEMYYCGYDLNKEQALEVAESKDGDFSKRLGVLAREFNIYSWIKEANATFEIIYQNSSLPLTERALYFHERSRIKVSGESANSFLNHKKTFLAGKRDFND